MINKTTFIFLILFICSGFVTSTICSNLLSSKETGKLITSIEAKQIRSYLKDYEQLPDNWKPISGAKLNALVRIIFADLAEFGGFKVSKLKKIPKDKFPELLVSPRIIAASLKTLKSEGNHEQLLKILQEIISIVEAFNGSGHTITKRLNDRKNYLEQYFTGEVLQEKNAEAINSRSRARVLDLSKKSVKEIPQEELSKLPKTWQSKKDVPGIAEGKLITLLLLLEADLSAFGGLSIVALKNVKISSPSLPEGASKVSVLVAALEILKNIQKHSELISVLEFYLNLHYSKKSQREKEVGKFTNFYAGIEYLKNYFGNTIPTQVSKKSLRREYSNILKGLPGIWTSKKNGKFVTSKYVTDLMDVILEKKSTFTVENYLAAMEEKHGEEVSSVLSESLEFIKDVSKKDKNFAAGFMNVLGYVSKIRTFEEDDPHVEFGLRKLSRYIGLDTSSELIEAEW